MSIEAFMSQADQPQDPQPADYFELLVDWAPAYELLMSLASFVTFRLHALLELGPSWARDVKQHMPPDLAARLSGKDVGARLKHEYDMVVLLIRACPGDRDSRAFLDWFARLTPGAAYEAVSAFLPETGTQLPRDFASWREPILELLTAWDAAYFQRVDPAILRGLRAHADALEARVGSEPAGRLVEEVTNGIHMEQSPELRTVTLVPQYHERPYNDDATAHGGPLILFPADVLPVPADVPPPGLMRLTRALSDDSRLRILRFLADRPCTLTEVARFIGLSQPTVHHHLVQLRAAGLVRVHFVMASPSRYSLRPHALEQLGGQLGAYLRAPPSSVRSTEASRKPRKERHG
jgi:DNA-binding transcriptional ArsR family regulator